LRFPGWQNFIASLPKNRAIKITCPIHSLVGKKRQRRFAFNSRDNRKQPQPLTFVATKGPRPSEIDARKSLIAFPPTGTGRPLARFTYKTCRASFLSIDVWPTYKLRPCPWTICPKTLLSIDGQPLAASSYMRTPECGHCLFVDFST